MNRDYEYPKNQERKKKLKLSQNLSFGGRKGLLIKVA